MQCLQCPHENPSDAKFCNQCGSPFAPVCLACGYENPAGAKFCNRCGTSLMAPTSVPGSVCLVRGDLPRALASLERVHGLCQDANVLTLFLLTIAHLGYAYTLSGRVAEALPLLEQAAEQSAHSGAFNTTLWFAWLGSGCQR